MNITIPIPEFFELHRSREYFRKLSEVQKKSIEEIEQVLQTQCNRVYEQEKQISRLTRTEGELRAELGATQKELERERDRHVDAPLPPGFIQIPEAEYNTLKASCGRLGDSLLHQNDVVTDLQIKLKAAEDERNILKLRREILHRIATERNKRVVKLQAQLEATEKTCAGLVEALRLEIRNSFDKNNV